MKVRHFFVPVLCGTLVLGLLAFAAGRERETELMRAVRTGELLRLHILADSDEEKAQSDKLAVRDAVLEALSPVLEGAANAAEAEARVRERLPLIEETARQTLEASGESYPVQARIVVADFPDRIYAGQLVPAGEYRALQIRLGKAEGHNWWCVLYPPLCFVGEETVETEEVRFESALLAWLRSLRKKGGKTA